jgi:hypothetical protein
LCGGGRVESSGDEKYSILNKFIGKTPTIHPQSNYALITKIINQFIFDNSLIIRNIISIFELLVPYPKEIDMTRKLSSLLRNDSGATAVEYGLIPNWVSLGTAAIGPVPHWRSAWRS